MTECNNMFNLSTPDRQQEILATGLKLDHEIVNEQSVSLVDAEIRCHYSLFYFLDGPLGVLF